MRSETKGLFASVGLGLRPDYYLRVGDREGILIEVERGKTIDNNMDLLDLWKTHVCEPATELFLLVPDAYRSNEVRPERSLFNAVYKRLATFFTPPNYTSVRTLWLFGY